MPPIQIILVLIASLAVRNAGAELTMPGSNENAATEVSLADTPVSEEAASLNDQDVSRTEIVAPTSVETDKDSAGNSVAPSTALLMPTVEQNPTNGRSSETNWPKRSLLQASPDLLTATGSSFNLPTNDGSERPGTISRASFTERIKELEAFGTDESFVLPVNFQSPYDDGSAEMMAIDDQFSMQDSSLAYRQSGLADINDFNIGVDLYSAPDFRDGLIVFGRNVAMKIGGYVKADFIYDADPIESTDSFDTTTIPVDAEPRTNSRFHARQTRLSFDTRWRGNDDIVRVFVEGDFFSEGNSFRLRHAFGEYGRLLVGKTWTTFTDVAAAPATLDFEGSVSSVNRRQAQARYTFPIIGDELTGAIAVEDTRFIIEVPELVVGESRSPSPDFVARVRWTTDWSQIQGAYLYRQVGFQPINQGVVTTSAGGFNFTGAALLTDRTKAYSQVLFGDGIGSYRLLPDAAPTSSTSAGLLGLFGWMVGVTHDWNDVLSSNFTYAENSLDGVAFQVSDDVKETTYMAVNLLATPVDRVTVGIEYLYGTREDVDGDSASANRIQTAFIFELP